MDFNRLLQALGVNSHTGSWGTPDLGITEGINNAIARVQGVAPAITPQGGSQLALTGNPQDNRQIQNAIRPNTGSVLGDATSGATAQASEVNPLTTNTTGGGGGGNQPPAGSNEVDLAGNIRRNNIDTIRSQAQNTRNTAQGNFDDILKAVGAFRDRSNTQFTNSGQQITDESSQRLGQNARTAREASGEARSRGRALGLGDSSKFALQNKVQGNLASTQGNVISRRGQENRSNDALLQERTDQAQTQEDQANTYLKGANERAATIENAGYSAADNTYTGALNDIVNYQRSLAAINPVSAGSLNQFNPDFGGITNTVNGVLNDVGGGETNTADNFANPVNPTDYLSLLRRKGLVAGA